MFHYYNVKRQFSYLIAFHSYFFRYKLLRVETMESTRLGYLHFFRFQSVGHIKLGFIWVYRPVLGKVLAQHLM